MKPMKPSVLLLWEEATDAIFERTSHFPKSLRGSLKERIEAITLEVLENLVEARYTPKPAELLKRTNLRLETLRMLLRLAYKRECLAAKGLGGLIEQIDRVGREIGGWQKDTALRSGEPGRSA